MCLSCKGIAHYFAVGFHAWGLQWGLQWGSAGLLALLGVGSMWGGGAGVAQRRVLLSCCFGWQRCWLVRDESITFSFSDHPRSNFTRISEN